MAVFGQKWLYFEVWLYLGKVLVFLSKLVVFGQKWLYSCKSGLYLGKSGCIRAKVFVFGKEWLYSGDKVIVFEKVL